MLILAGLLALPTLLYWPVIFGGRTLIPADNLFTFQPWRAFAPQFGISTPHNSLLSDLILENYVWKRFILESLRAGQPPLWNPYLFAGVPFLAAGQHSALYPFSLIFYIFPLWWAYGAFAASQVFLAGAFMYLFLRVLGVGRLGATLGAMTYALSGFMLVSVVFPMIVAGAAWLPLILACIELALRRQPALGGRPTRLPWVAAGALALGCQVLAGHIEITLYTLMVAAAYAAWRLLRRTGDGGRTTDVVGAQGLAPLLAPRLSSVVAMMGLGLGLGAIQLVPLFDVVQSNFRQGAATFEQIQGWAYPPRHIAAFLVPNIFGNPAHHTYVDLFTGRVMPAPPNPLVGGEPTLWWGIKNYVEGGAYVGILPLLLAVIAVLSWLHQRGQRRRRTGLVYVLHRDRYDPAPVPFFAILALVALAFAFGTPLYRLIFWLPGVNQLHSPFRWVWPYTLAVAVLAGFGVEAARRMPAEGVRRLGGLAALTGVAVVAAVGLGRLFFDTVEPAVTRLWHGLALADRAFPDVRVFYSYEGLWVGVFGLTLAASGLILLNLPGSSGVRRGSLALGLLALDLLLAGAGFNPAAPPELLEFKPPVVSFLEQDKGLWRLTSYTREDLGTSKTFNANVGMFYGFQDVRGYDSIIPRQYAEYMALIQPQGELLYNRIAPITQESALNSPLLDLLNVKYILSELPIDNPRLTLVYDGEVKVYRNEEALPRAFTLPLGCAVTSADVKGALQRYDPRHTVILEGPERAPSADPAACAPTAATVTSYQPGEVWVDVALAEPGWLVLGDSFAPGWVAFVRPIGGTQDKVLNGLFIGVKETDEREVQIVRADGNFRAVRLEAGQWTVRFRYSPFPVKLGLFGSFMAGVVIVFLLGVWLWGHVYTEAAVNSTARRVAKNSLAPMALNLMNRAVDFAFAALMLRILGPDNAGKYYFAGVIIGWFEILTNFGLNTLLTREVARDRAQANRYLANTTILRLLLLGLSTPLLLAVIAFWRAQFGLGTDTALAILLLAVALVPGSLSTGLTALFYAYEQAEYPAAITVITVLLKVGLGTPVLLLGGGFVGLAAVAIVVNLATLIILGTLAVRRFFRPYWESDARLRWEMARESWPLMINHLLATLFFKVDVPLLNGLKGNTVVGWYSTAYKWVDALNIIPSYFTLAAFPAMTRQATESKEALLRSYHLSIKLLVMIALPVALITVALAEPLTLLLGGPQYLPHAAIALQLMVVSIPFGWINSLTNYVLIALGQQTKLTRAFALALAFNFTANLVFIPRTAHGYEAAAVITIFSEIVEGAAFYYYLRRSLGAIPWGALFGRLVLAALAMAGAMALLVPLSLALAVLVGLVSYVAALVLLGVLGQEERELVRALLPRRWGAQPEGEPGSWTSIPG